MTRKTSGNKRRSTVSSKLALVAGMLAAPVLLIPATGLAQGAPQQQFPRAQTVGPAKAVDSIFKFKSEYLKLSGTYDIVGESNRHTIYKDARGRYFYLDGATGDMKFLSADYFLKIDGIDVKGESQKVTILGMNSRGDVIQKNNRGETFYLDPANGNMVFVTLNFSKLDAPY